MKINALQKMRIFVWYLYHRCEASNCRQTAASLTYTTLLALAPLVTIGVMAFSAFPVFEQAMIALKIFLLTHLVPEAAGHVISGYMHQFSQNAGKLTAVGLVSFAVTAMMLLLTIERALNAIWHVSEARPWSVRLLTYWALLTVGPVLLGGSLWLGSYLVSVPLGWVPHMAPVKKLAVELIPLALQAVGFTLLYWVVPNRYVPLKHAIWGGAIAGLGFVLLGRGFAWYWVHFNTYSIVYGTFALLPAFLVWVYLSWWVVLFGAVLTSALGQWRHSLGRQQLSPLAQVQTALEILLILYRNQLRGQPMHLHKLAEAVHCGVEEAEQLMMQLRSLGWVARLPRSGWVLQTSADSIELKELFGLLCAGGQPLTGLLAEVVETAAGRLSLSLHQYSEQTGR